MGYGRILIVDDHGLYRTGLRLLLADSFESIEEARDGDEAVRLAVALQPDVVVMDIRMPGTGGIEATEQIKQKLPDTAIVVVSESDDVQDVLGAIGAGACGYVLKNEDPDIILMAISAAAEGKSFLSSGPAKRVMESVASGGSNPEKRQLPDTPLSPRQVTILRLIALGKHNKEIAREVGITESTVGNHIAEIYARLGIGSRAEAILYAFRRGLVQL